MTIPLVYPSSTLWLLLAATTVPAAPPRAAVDPNAPDKNRTMISREERERLGLAPHTWTGVVHPDVYQRLDKLTKMVESLKSRNDLDAVDARQRVRFEGTVYVQVQLKDRDARHSVLANLKASEFYVQQLFEESDGFIGYAKKEAVDKLARDPGVVSVCLDDKPIPERPTPIYKNDLPPVPPGDPSSTAPGVEEKKVTPDVYRALAMNSRIYVLVSLRRDSLPALTDRSSEMKAQWEQRKQAEEQLQNRALSGVSASEFWLFAKLGSGVAGYVDRQGLDKLWRNPDVRLIHLDEARRVPERRDGKRFSP